MAIVTTYSCDKCRHSQKTDDQMWKIKVAYNTLRSYGSADYWSSRAQLWCRRCLENAGLVVAAPDTKRDAPPPNPPPTLEDLVREIAADVAIDVVRDRAGA